MFAGDGEFQVAIVDQRTAQDACIDREIVPPKCILDCNFPETGSTEDELIRLVVDEFAGRGRKPFWKSGCPEENVRIEQNFLRSAFEHRLDIAPAHPVKVIRHAQLALEEAQALDLCRGRRTKWYQLRDRLAGPSDDHSRSIRHTL